MWGVGRAAYTPLRVVVVLDAPSFLMSGVSVADRKTAFAIALACFCCVGLVGCADPGRGPEARKKTTDADIHAEPVGVSGSGSQQDADAVAKAVEATVVRRDSAGLHALFDNAQFVNQVFAGLHPEKKFRAEAEAAGLSKLSTNIMSAVEGGGDYGFVRHVKRGTEIRPLFRLLHPNAGGLNYHELIVARDATGQPRISDIHVYISGERASQSIRRLVLPAVAANNEGIVAWLAREDAAIVRNFSILKKIIERNEAQDFPEAYRLILTLPRQLRKDKSILLLKLVIAQQLGSDEYLKTIRELEEAWPNDPASDLWAIDVYATQGNHEKVIEAVDRLIAATEDPYLNYLQVDGLVSLGRIDEARAAIAAARAAGVDTLDVHWVELGFLLSAREHAATADMLDTIAGKFGIQFEDILEIPEYADFVASEPGKAWMRKRAEE